MSTLPSPVTAASTLTVTAWHDPVLDAIGHDPRSAYVEHFWLGIIGPASTFLLRRMAAALEDQHDVVELDAVELAASIGVGYRDGRNNAFRRSLDRLVTFGLAQQLDERTFAVRLRVPPLSRRQIQRLPPALRDDHHRWLEHDRAVSPADEIRRRARALALSLLELGELRDAAERQLHRWRFHPAIAHDALRWATAERRRRIDDDRAVAAARDAVDPAGHDLIEAS